MIKYVIFTEDELNAMIKGKAVVYRDEDTDLETHYICKEDYENIMRNTMRKQFND